MSVFCDFPLSHEELDRKAASTAGNAAGKIIRVPGATYGLFRLIIQIAFLETVSYSDTKKCHGIYFKVLSSLYF